MSPGAEHGDVDDEPASTLTWASALVLDVAVGERLLGSQKWGSEWGWAKSSEPPSRGVATKRTNTMDLPEKSLGGESEWVSNKGMSFNIFNLSW